MGQRFALAVFLPLIAMLAATPTTSSIGIGSQPPTRLAAVPVPSELRLNEVDYDQPGYDTNEFVEIVNVGSEKAHLKNVVLVFVNGYDSTEYRRVELSGGLGTARRLVVATPSVAVGGSPRVLYLPLSKNNIQNGAPDGVALVDTANDVVLDALSYEGSIENAQIEGLTGAVSLVQGQPVSESDDNEVAGSLCRLPDRSDTGEDDADRSICSPTPGTKNAART